MQCCNRTDDESLLREVGEDFLEVLRAGLVRRVEGAVPLASAGRLPGCLKGFFFQQKNSFLSVFLRGVLLTLEDDLEERLNVLAPRSRSLRSEREETLEEPCCSTG